MSSKVVSISTDDTLQTVSEIMELGSVRHLPVVRRGELMGVVSQRDLLHHRARAAATRDAEAERW